MTALVWIPPQQLSAVWDQVRPGVEAVREKCGEPWRQEDVYAAIKAGESQLWARPNLESFLVLSVRQEGYSGKQYLFVWLCWAANGAENVIAENTEQIKQIARQASLGTVAFESPRKGWERAAPAAGWQPQSTRWLLEV